MAEGRDKQSMGVVTSLTVNPATPYQLNYRGESSGIVRGTGADWFGPLNPLEPTAPPEVKGRSFDIPSGYNLNIRPRAYEAITFDQLRSFADGYDLLRTVIETRKDQLARLSWNVVARSADKKRAKDPAVLERITKVEKFFLRPDGEHFWDDWLRMVIEDLLVLDAPAIFRRRTFGGSLYALEPIDGGTIKRVIDDWGRTPSAPAPAYQQVLKGFPAVDYTVNDLIYRPRNVRTHKVYGYSPVEQIVMTINIAIRRQVWQLQSFTEGNIPEALIGTPSTWTPDQIRAFQDWFDSLLEGNTGERRRARFVPGEVSKGYVATKPSELFGQAEEWLARIVCFAFNISAQPFVAMMNRATAETAQETAVMDGLAPLQQWVKNLIDTVILDDFGYDDVEFQWLDEDELDPNIKSTILDREVASGMLTMNEARAEKGLDPYDHEDADRPMFKSAQGYIPIYASPEEETEADARVAAADAQAAGGEVPPSAEGEVPDTDIAPEGDEASGDGSPATPDEGVAEKSDRPFAGTGLTKFEFDESKISRDENGRFTGSGGGSGEEWQQGGWSGEKVYDPQSPMGESWDNPTDTAKYVDSVVEQMPVITSGLQSGYKENPLPRVDRQELPESTVENIKSGNWSTVEVHPSQLVSGQEWVSGSKLVSMTAKDPLKLSEEDRSPTAVRRDDGTYRVIDGNHRAALSLILDQPITLRVVGEERSQVSKAAKPTSPGVKFVVKAEWDEDSHPRDENGGFGSAKSCCPSHGNEYLHKASRPAPPEVKFVGLERRKVVSTEKKLRARLRRFLVDAGENVAAQARAKLKEMGKADDDFDIDAFLSGLDLSMFEGLDDEFREFLEGVAADSGRTALSILGSRANDLVDQVNERSVSWAREHAADLAGINEDSPYALDETTRDMLRATIAGGIEDNLSAEEIGDQIEDAYAFSEERADLIAMTEVAAANSYGALAGYEEAASLGITVRKSWLMLEDACDICQENADAGVIDLDEEFPSGDLAPPGHPNCRCVLVPEVEDEEGNVTESESEEPEEE